MESRFCLERDSGTNPGILTALRLQTPRNLWPPINATGLGDPNFESLTGSLSGAQNF